MERWPSLGRKRSQASGHSSTKAAVNFVAWPSDGQIAPSPYRFTATSHPSFLIRAPIGSHVSKASKMYRIALCIFIKETMAVISTLLRSFKTYAAAVQDVDF
ncbi:hypothetical protein O181_001304 [Austropuccinia psidii MF-1]|uniref:Uncharacterized protein n=1 Tax=Austropuccinia psidii MF-1 TaxID=1389203 RepID=A0A9Q3GBQ6_9BASI|nr:hypothetical protein [Austropuccinia psidii MF-1]